MVVVHVHSTVTGYRDNRPDSPCDSPFEYVAYSLTGCIEDYLYILEGGGGWAPPPPMKLSTPCAR